MASGVYNKVKKMLLDATIDLDTDTIKVMLVTSSYTPNADHDFVDDISGNELSGTGYTAGFGNSGRKTLSNKSVTQDDATDKGVFDNTADLTWSSINAGTAAYAVLIKEITSDAASIPICWLELSPNVTTNGGDLTVAFNTSGIINLT